MNKYKLLLVLLLATYLSTNAQKSNNCTFVEIQEVDEKPAYNTDEEGLTSHIGGILEFPESARDLDMYEVIRAYVTIDCTGKISAIDLSGDVEILKEEVDRALRTLEDWQPAVSDGVAVSTTIELRVYFWEDGEYFFNVMEFSGLEEVYHPSVNEIEFIDIRNYNDEQGIDIAEFQEAPIPEEMRRKQQPFVTVEQMPSYPGGESEMYKFLSANLRYDNELAENGIGGRVTVRFVIEATGEVTDVQVMRGVHKDLDKEAVRAIKAMPNWVPGKQNGKAVPVYFTLPIIFKNPAN